MTKSPRQQSLCMPAWLPGAVLAGVLLVVAAVYSQVCTFQFLPFWDDDTNIQRNPLYAPLSWGSVALFWEGPFQQLYIPVTYTAWAALVALSRIVAGTSVSFGPINAAIFHGANLLVHLLSVSMVFLILRRLLGASFRKGASPRMLLFASDCTPFRWRPWRGSRDCAICWGEPSRWSPSLSSSHGLIEALHPRDCFVGTGFAMRRPRSFCCSPSVPSLEVSSLPPWRCFAEDGCFAPGNVPGSHFSGLFHGSSSPWPKW